MNKLDRLVIETERMQLVCCDLPMLEAYFDGEATLAKLLDIGMPENWTEFGEPAFRWTHNALLQPEGQKEWYCYLPVLKNENLLVGTCGFKGPPKNGMVEIGYEIARDYRGQGLATELAAALIRFAFATPAVNLVQAHTLAVANESGTVLTKCGMSKMETITDPEDGTIWRWEVRSK
ncbi:MAG: GNAT family N-acetyltransferase [Gemmatimonadaceae bacterium]|nr:GNAT family N-acetyltransferase [Chitinophagaceae bacterium]